MDLQKQLDLTLQDALLYSYGNSACHPIIIELLLSAGANPKIIDRQTALNSALTDAVIRCRPAVVELLLNAGATPSGINFYHIGSRPDNEIFDNGEWYDNSCLKIYDLLADYFQGFQSVVSGIDALTCHSKRLIDQIIDDFPNFFHNQYILSSLFKNHFKHEEYVDRLIELNADINIDYEKIEYVHLFDTKKFPTLEKINDFFPVFIV